MTLSTLEQWYASQCNGDWEHQYGVSIDTLDNPGWKVRMDLRETVKQSAKLDLIKIERSEHDWIQYWIEKQQFHIACGSLNLSEAVDLFLRWFDD